MENQKKDSLFKPFLGVSILWSLVVLYFLIDDQFLYNGYSPMPLNEIGDFLAGSFSPLAFAWLAYGYWMQNKELKYNRLSLESQIYELKRSIEISEKNLNLQERTLKEKNEEAKRKSKPKLIIFETDHMENIGGNNILRVPMKNIGAKITNIKIFTTFHIKGLLTSIDIWDNNQEKTIELKLSSYTSHRNYNFKGEHLFEFEKIEFEYTDSRGIRVKIYLNIYAYFKESKIKFTANFYEINDELFTDELG